MSSSFPFRIHALLAGVLLSFCGGEFALAESVTLTPVADTSIFQESPLNNLGAVQSLAVGNNARNAPFRALIQFDVQAALPVGAVVTRAQLQLTIGKSPGSARPAEFALHRLLVSWGEGVKGTGTFIGTGEPATSGEANWNFRFHPATTWSEPGGAAGVDYVATSSASAPEGFTEVLNFESSAATVADVQNWLESPGSNFGWLLKEHAESNAFTARRIGSREHSTDAPRLTIDYTLPFQIRSVSVTEGNICLRFATQAGKAYVLERRALVDTGNWTTVTNLPVSEASEEVVIRRPVEAGNHFYRVGEQ